MKFGVQVKVWNPHKGEYEWLWMQPPGGPRYEWGSGDEAHRMKEMCYPLTTVEWVRVAQITEEETPCSGTPTTDAGSVPAACASVQSTSHTAA